MNPPIPIPRALPPHAKRAERGAVTPAMPVAAPPFPFKSAGSVFARVVERAKP